MQTYRADAWTALGDRTRKAIFELLLDRPRAVSELAGELPVSRPAVSQHLRVLKDAGLVSDQSRGTRRIYRVDPDGLAALRTDLERFWGQALTAYQAVVEQPTQGGGMSSHTQAIATTVSTSIVVKAPIERAFAAFTEEFDQIKPREHNMLAVDIAETVFEPHAGGSVYDRGVDGSEYRWARVLAYEPPHRVVFSWDISPRWQIESDPDRCSEVEVRFVAETPERTRVSLEHRYLDRHGDGWDGLREGVGGDQGWPLYLARYEALLH
ncbi:MAG TPA: metalloregulator ArsR/SmtB family transcription factor [Solirubrobacteraceae bacterium]|nr:metalloregulator ArsR/SmtB family transcription factor [Solirubrobacteraceae bacterium]